MADDNTGTIIEPTTNGQDNNTTGLTTDPNAGQAPAADQAGPTISVGTPPSDATPVDVTTDDAATNDTIASADVATSSSPFPEPQIKPVEETATAPIPSLVPSNDDTTDDDAATDDAAEPENDDSSPAPSAADQDLLKLKQTALQELSPLVDELDLPPEEEFETLLMMIQSSDSDELIPRAHEAATKIQDKKERAEALLDIVNEINYFTQK